MVKETYDKIFLLNCATAAVVMRVRPIFCIISTIPVLFPSFQVAILAEESFTLIYLQQPAAHASVRVRPSVRRFVLQLQLSFLCRSPAKLQSLQRRRRRQNTSHSRSCLPKPPPSLPPSPHLSTSIHRSRMLTVSSTKALTHWSCTINHILATYAG